MSTVDPDAPHTGKSPEARRDAYRADHPARGRRRSGADAAAAARRTPRADHHRGDAGVRAYGFTATSLDDIAAEAGISRVILYWHFDSKTDLYQAVLDRACIRLAETVGTADYGEQAIPPCWPPRAPTPTGSGCCSATPPANPTSTR